MTIFTNRWTAGLASLIAAVTMLGAGTMNQTEDKPGQVGVSATDFTLLDLDGVEHTLSEYTAQGQIVVLEWFNSTCPFVKKHYREDTMTMVNLQKQFAEQEIVWLRINSAHEGHTSAGVEFNKAAAKDWGITTPILLDPEGTVGRAYGAKRTPEMYIIDTAGMLVYHGAIDDERNAIAPGEVNFVSDAITDVLAGEPVKNASNKPYGCNVKYN